MEPVKTYIVLPCYNEEEVLSETSTRLLKLLDMMLEENLVSDESRIVFVDDGSKDSTWSIIKELSEKNKYVNGIKLAKNAGHQNALFAGLMTVKASADCVISIDADLQDDINVIRDFVLKFREGFDIVYGVRSKRKSDSFFKRNTALFFYKLMKTMGVNIVFNHADYRLMSRRSLEALSEFSEVNLFLRGIVPLVGYTSTNIYYERHERFAGKSKYPLNKMLAFAVEGITSFSITPIRIVTVIGFLFSLISVFVALYGLLSNIFGYTVSGWTSLIVSIWLIGGIQLLALGLIGEYIGKIYKEVKRRPRFIIEEHIND
jgi:glycosyltransferase involved in cell wall biosynthesis